MMADFHTERVTEKTAEWVCEGHVADGEQARLRMEVALRPSTGRLAVRSDEPVAGEVCAGRTWGEIFRSG
jgi:hypothetical protein